jgi:hypothetical protein
MKETVRDTAPIHAEERLARDQHVTLPLGYEVQTSLPSQLILRTLTRRPSQTIQNVRKS